MERASTRAVTDRGASTRAVTNRGASSEPVVGSVALSAGTFRVLEWPGVGLGSGAAPEPPPIVFLHGLSGVAEVWTDTVAALGPDRPRCIALDQRGHGHSPRTPGAYAVGHFLTDAVELITALAKPVHLVGHSMGARVAILAAARRPELLCSATIVDIGPEAWKANITATTRLFSSLPRRFVDRNAAMELGRLAGRGETWADRFVDWRLRAEPDGSYAWLGSPDDFVEMVTSQRARGYWSDWERIEIAGLLVRGGTSNELRPRVTDAMRRRNPSIGFVEFEGIGHNIPLLASERLAAELDRFHGSLPGAAADGRRRR